MPVLAQPYINFDGDAEEALNFYKKAVGAEVTMLMRYKDAPGSHPEVQDKIMHSVLRIGTSELLVSDGRNTGKRKFEGIAISLTTKDEAEAERCFNALADGGSVQMPLGATFFAKSFGMLQDKYGLGWMVICPAA